MNVVAIWLLLYGLLIHSNCNIRAESERGLSQGDFPLDVGLSLFFVDPGAVQPVATHT